VLRPSGALARLCAGLEGASAPAGDTAQLYDDGSRLLLGVVALLLAGARGLVPGVEAAQAPDSASWGGLHELFAAAARRSPAPELFEAGERLTRRRGLDQALLAGLLRDLTELPGHGRIDYRVVPVRLLGTLYEGIAGHRLACPSGRARLVRARGGRAAAGVYYTPAPIVAEIMRATVGRSLRERLERVEQRVRPALDALRDAGDEAGRLRLRAEVEREIERFVLEDALGLQVLDPAMGCGFFLLAAAEEIAAVIGEAHRLAPWRPCAREEWLAAAAERCVTGVDLHPQAVELARLSLWLACARPGGELSLAAERLFCGESLLGVDWERRSPSLFDAVVGNPPWGAALVGGRAELRRSYRSAVGEPESAALFIELALRLVRPGGRVGLVTPNTWLTLVRQEPLRRLVLGAGQIELLAEHEAGAFSAVRAVVPLVFTVRRGGPPCTTRVCVRGEEREADQRGWLAAPAAVIDLRRDAALERALARMDSCSTPLGRLAEVRYGIKTGANAANIAAAPLTGQHRPALVRGAEVRRHVISWAGNYLRYGPHLAGYRHSAPDVPKIVVQYIRNLSLPRRLVAAVDHAGRYIPLNNFSYIAGPQPGYDLFYLAALLCSTPLNGLFAARYRDYNIKPAYLRLLPVRRIAFTTPAELRARLVREAESLPAGDLARFVDEQLAAAPERADVVHDLLASLARRAAQAWAEAGEAGEAAARATDELIDAVVCRLYGLDAQDAAALAGV